MLKIKLDKGKDIDKLKLQISAALNKVLQESKDNNILRIIVYPSLENIIGGLMLFNVALNLNIKASISTRLNAPSKITDPTILIGYSNLNYKVSDIESVLVSLSHEINEIPIGNSTFVEINGSIGSGIYFALKGSDIINVKPEYAILSLASTYASKYVSKSGEFSSFDKDVIETLITSDDSLNMEIVTGLKIFRPTSLNFCESLSITLNPLYLTLTNEDSCQRFLKENGFEMLINSNIGKIDNETNKNITVSIYKYLKDNIIKNKIDIQEYVGGVGVSKARIVMQDPREVIYSIMLLIETMGFHSAVGLIADYENEYPQIPHYLRSSVKIAEDVILNNKFNRASQINFAKVYVTNEDNLPITAIQKQLKIMGYIDNDAILGYLDKNKLKIPILSLEDSLGYGSAARFIQTFKGEFDGESVWIKIV
ncbi:hypothetical protein Calag_0450 [Caldisphaera lagunensis DSM 15908]|uniref:Single-stranded DNA-specific exonuclease n=1 Tax=Caldisphaera lagunensis (strain DSM 15908 / JCM 11604 / ANMR 0165 / IC-154) TaxID=1056495 RepID=L0AAS1_CALLD|nr:hypothetical protein [Caldisphaera lagunensis]AFZ70217.1 hypothetical protein Calag_0450 [Caldisphaera lagunensis DSM 15908]